jgi:hypothetical protein
MYRLKVLSKKGFILYALILSPHLHGNVLFTEFMEGKINAMKYTVEFSDKQ